MLDLFDVPVKLPWSKFVLINWHRRKEKKCNRKGKKLRCKKTFTYLRADQSMSFAGEQEKIRKNLAMNLILKMKTVFFSIAAVSCRYIQIIWFICLCMRRRFMSCFAKPVEALKAETFVTSHLFSLFSSLMGISLSCRFVKTNTLFLNLPRWLTLFINNFSVTKKNSSDYKNPEIMNKQLTGIKEPFYPRQGWKWFNRLQACKKWSAQNDLQRLID